jgi:hypothetical protein
MQSTFRENALGCLEFDMIGSTRYIIPKRYIGIDIIAK